MLDQCTSAIRPTSTSTGGCPGAQPALCLLLECGRAATTAHREGLLAAEEAGDGEASCRMLTSGALGRLAT
ncbi:hypothetical protein, partial [Streptomyces sp. NPDC051657]|uniref:hypothetical protein n=1 Tax=Streptomyces sp. NPDC051657 TaxID=3154749 RepID=UPI003436BCEB